LGLAGFLDLVSGNALAFSCAAAQAFSPAGFDKVKKTVDPHSQMGESTRNLAAIGAIYQFQMNRGNTDGAACAAFQMIQFYRVVADKYAAIAAAAGEKGKTDVMVHAAMKAYANIPDGQDFTVTKTPEGLLNFSFTDDHGKVISRRLEPPDKLAASAMGFAQSGFEKTLRAAAEPEIALRAAGAARGVALGKPAAMIEMLPTPPLDDMPAERPQGPKNCVTVDLGGGIRTTNCN
jgi:hypothetical protein